MLQEQLSLRPRIVSDHLGSYFLAGAVAAVKLHLLGEIYVGEILAVCYVAYRLSRLALSRQYAPLFGMALLWTLAQAASDVANDTALVTSLKGVLVPVLFMVTIYAFGTYFRAVGERCVWYFLAGTAFSTLVFAVLQPSPEALENPWKWGYALPVLTLLSIWLSTPRTGKATTILGVLAFCAVSAAGDFRSLAAIPLIGLLILLCRHRPAIHYVRRIALTRGGMAAIFLVIALVIYALNLAFSAIFAHAAEFGFLSSEAAHKYTVQATSQLGILFGGRSEILVSLQAFLDAPLLGHGSWAVDRNGYLEMYSKLTYELGISLGNTYDAIDTDLIPTHSYLMGALVWSGIAGGLFWLYMLSHAIRTFMCDLPQTRLYFCIAMVQFVWDVLFSPFGADHRWATALFLGMLFAWHQRQAKLLVRKR